MWRAPHVCLFRGLDLRYCGFYPLAVFFFKQKTAYEVRISDWSSDVCSSDLLAQLAEEGATQFFRPLMSNDLILGAVGALQFDVAAYRLKDEYGVESAFEQVQVATARWIKCADAKKLEEFREKNAMNLAIDGAGELVYLAPTRVNLQLAQERAPGVEFMATREQAHVVAAR